MRAKHVVLREALEKYGHRLCMLQVKPKSIVAPGETVSLGKGIENWKCEHQSCIEIREILAATS